MKPVVRGQLCSPSEISRAKLPTRCLRLVYSDPQTCDWINKMCVRILPSGVCRTCYTTCCFYSSQHCSLNQYTEEISAGGGAVATATRVWVLKGRRWSHLTLGTLTKPNLYHHTSWTAADFFKHIPSFSRNPF